MLMSGFFVVVRFLHRNHGIAITTELIPVVHSYHTCYPVARAARFCAVEGCAQTGATYIPDAVPTPGNGCSSIATVSDAGA